MAEKELQKGSTVKEKELLKATKSVEVIDTTSIDEESLDNYEHKISLVLDQYMSELTPIEMDVLSVANEILKKKRFPIEIEAERIETMSPMVDQIYAKSIARFENQKGYKKETIFKAIQSLENKRWIITGQRMTKQEILENPIKKSLLAFIEKFPGVHARDSKINEELNITRNPFIKHMASLEAFGLIRSIKIGSTLNYFPVDLPDVFDDLAVMFHNPVVVNIIQALLKDNNITLMDLANEIGVYHRAIQYHIKFLLQHNVLLQMSASEIKANPEQNVDSRRKYYRVNTDLLMRYNRLFRIPPFKEWI